MIKVLFVCLGNICRSPLAEGVFKKKVQELGLNSQITADSAGTASYHVGQNPDPRTIEIAKKNNIIIDHKGQQFKKKHVGEFDYLIAMDQSNYNNMVSEMGEGSSKLSLMRDFDPQGTGKDVPDPYYGGADGFEHVYQILDRSAGQLLKHIRENHDL